MKHVIQATAVFTGLIWGGSAFAQDSYWIQVGSVPTLAAGEETARALDAGLDPVAGFRLGADGWYAVVLGPFEQAEAVSTFNDLRASGAIPEDAFVSEGDGFAAQFYPVGATGGDTAAPVIPEETPQEARRSEAQLDRPAREQLQIALQFEGFYTSGIDGAFGPGTRGAMRAWQEYKGYEPTGVLTTRQRAELIADYNAVFDSLALARVTDADAGIEITLPTAMVEFDRYEAPFAHYQGEDGVRVVLISQSGGQSTLYGLYDILQSLDVVPPTGERNRGENSFEINGEDSRIVSYTYAEVLDGSVKGYMLIWPKGDDKRRAIALEAAQESFASTGAAVLDDNAGLDEAMQSVDLVSGLEIRRADKARTGFYVTGEGTVLTTAEAVAGCTQITLDESYPASVVAVNDALGAAIVAPDAPLAPAEVADFFTSDARIQSDLAVAGYSFGGRLSSATLTFGALADIKGLDGEAEIYRLDLESQDGDQGGPILDGNGRVLGMLQSDADSARQFPAEVSFAAKSAALVEFLTANTIEMAEPATSAPLTPNALTDRAAKLAVLVSCWE